MRSKPDMAMQGLMTAIRSEGGSNVTGYTLARGVSVLATGKTTSPSPTRTQPQCLAVLPPKTLESYPPCRRLTPNAAALPVSRLPLALLC